MGTNNAYKNILVIHGPNLNLLGEREPDVYGIKTLDDINRLMDDHAKNRNVKLKFFQSNHEGEIIDCIHQNRAWANGIVINPGALTHYSYALHDALVGVNIPAVEVHLSDIGSREGFRRQSVTAPACLTQISGHGEQSYIKGIDSLLFYYQDSGY